MGVPSVPSLLLILAIVILIFGAKRLRNLGGDLGAAVKGFKSAVKDENADPAQLGADEEAVDSTAMNKSDDKTSA